ncbi:lysylphosphatidylglycerol synthase domain-containing protein [Clostridioides difficile]
MDRLKNIRKSLLQYTFLFLLIGITIYLVFKTLDIKMLSNVMVMVDKKFLFIGALAIMCHIMLEGVVMKIIIESTHKVNIRFIGFKLAIMGFYYNLITPFASGSQPVQIYVLKNVKCHLVRQVQLLPISLLFSK